jgi:general nucleoside transport system permease protein
MDPIVLLISTIALTTPLLLAALGGLYSERSGVVNVALEGMIIFGALTAAVVAQQLEVPFLAQDPDARVWWIPWVAVVVAMVVGGLVAAIHAVMSIKYKADQVISSTAINLLAIGMPPVILQFLYNNTTDSLPVQNILPKWGFDQFSFSPITYLALVLVPITSYVIYRTPFGLHLRACGESPQAAASVGVNVIQTRYIAVILSGVLAALAGAFLSLGNLNNFTRNISANQGFIALAALIFGKWMPSGTLGATLLFGFFAAAAIQLGGSDFLPQSIVQIMPFVITILVLAGFIGRSRAPKAVGQPYP